MSPGTPTEVMDLVNSTCAMVQLAFFFLFLGFNRIRDLERNIEKLEARIKELEPK